VFGGQRFVRHVAADAVWQRGPDGVSVRDTGIGVATHGLASVRVLREMPPALPLRHAGEFLFLYALSGGLTLHGDAHGSQRLVADDSCVVPADVTFRLDADADCEMLEVRLPAVGAV
jgi:hypothetical protein